MKALVIEAVGVTRFTEVDQAKVGPGDVRVSVRHVGICGSDLNTFRGFNPLVTLPRIPGHEIGGEIVEVGTEVPAEYRIGRRVIVLPYTNCGQCASCRKGRPNACRYNRTLGVQQDGGLAEEIILPAEKLILNDTLAPRFLALVEPLSVGFHAARRGKIQAGESVAVIGCGMIGMGAVIGAVSRGAEVTAIDLSAEKTALAARFGAKHQLNPGVDDVAARISGWTDGLGVDVAIEAVGLPATFVQAVDLAGFSGRVVYVGYAKEPVSYETQIFNLKELDIMGSRNATIEDFEAVISYLEGIGEAAGELISRIFSFEEADLALPFWHQNRDILKVIIER